MGHGSREGWSNWRHITSIQGGMLANYNLNFSRGLGRPDTKSQLSQRSGIYAPLTFHVDILFSATT